MPARKPRRPPARARKPPPPARSRAPARRPRIDVLEGRPPPRPRPVEGPAAEITIAQGAPVPVRVTFAAWGLLLAGLAMVTTSATTALVLGPERAVLPRDAALREGYAMGAALAVGFGILATFVGGATVADPSRMRRLARVACAGGAGVCGLAIVAFLVSGLTADLEPRAAVHALAGVAGAFVVAMALGILARALRPFPHIAQTRPL